MLRFIKTAETPTTTVNILEILKVGPVPIPDGYARQKG